MLVKRLDDLLTTVDEAGYHLATSPTVPAEVDRALREVRTARTETPPGELETLDPYLVLALDRGLLTAWEALGAPGEGADRPAMRVALEQVRQALRDLREDGVVAETRPAKEIAGWLDGVLDVPQAELAGLLDVSRRQWQRWASASDPAEPRGEEARRMRVLARLAAHLRHVLTGPGVAAWLRRPHPALGGAAPATLLSRTEAAPHLAELASAARSTRAA